MHVLIAALFMGVLSLFAGVDEARAANCTGYVEAGVCILDVPTADFRGTDYRPADYHVRVCLPDDIRQLITDQNGYYGWTIRRVNSSGSWVSANVAELVNQPCADQWVRHGERVAVLVNCPENIWTGGPGYVGWIMTDPTTNNGSPALHRHSGWDYIPPDIREPYKSVVEQYIGQF